MPEHPAMDQLLALGGEVVDESGAPIEGALVVASPRGYEAWTGAEGHFELAPLPFGEAIELRVHAEGFASSTRTLTHDRERELRIGLASVTPAGPALRVQLLDPVGEAVEGALVEAGGLHTTSDGEGLAWLEGLEGQQVDLRASHPEHWDGALEGLELPLGGAQVELVLAGRADGAHEVGSSWCFACHQEQTEAWEQSAHASSLETLPSELALRFEEGDELLVGAAHVQLQAGPRALLTDATGEERSFEVRGAIGLVPWVESEGRAWPLPFAWVDEAAGRPGFPDSGAGLVAFQTERWLDEEGRFLELSPSQSAEASCFPCHATGWSFEADEAGGGSLTGAEGRWLEPVVGCERCHGPASEHLAARDERKPLLITRADDLGQRSSEVCASCHGAVESHGGWPFALSDVGTAPVPGSDIGELRAEPRTWSSGAASAPGQQADELELGAHAGVLGCIDCHEPHGGQIGHASLRKAADDNELCASCHLGLDFEGDSSLLAQHTGHLYEPEGLSESGRCIGCHMPATAARVSHSDWTGDGDRSSHLFLALAPAQTLAHFGSEALEPGDYPAHACGSCHGWNAWLDEDFAGVDGDPGQASTHQAHQAAYEAMFP